MTTPIIEEIGLDLDYIEDGLEAEFGPADDDTKILSSDDSDFVNKIVTKICLFADELAGEPLYPYQAEFARRVVESIVLNDGDQITALFSRQCIDGDSVVFRRDGTAVRMRNHENAFSTGVKPTKRYRVRGGADLIMTDNHPVWTEEGWTAAGLLRVGSRVSVATSVPAWRDDTVVEREVVLDRGTAPTRRWTVREEVDAPLTKLLGYFVTDGSHRPRQSAKFTNTREEYLSEFSELMEKRFGIVPRRYDKGNGADLLITSRGQRPGDNRFRDLLRALEWDHGFPTDVFAWEPQVVADFVNRAWAGDGCVSMTPVGPAVFLACGLNETYARYWQALLLKYGVMSTVKAETMSKSTAPFYRLVVGSGARNVRRFFMAFGLVYGKEEQSAAALSYFDSKIELPSGKGRAERKMYPFSGLGADGEEGGWSTVVAIDDAGVREVFDMEVANKSWFVAQGLQVSNSGKTQSVAYVVAACMILLPKLATMWPEWFGQYKNGFWVGTFAPVESQAETLFQRIQMVLTSETAQEVLADPEIDDKVEGGGKLLRLKVSGSICRMQTANPKAQIESKSYHFIIVDEAQRADDRVINKCVAAGTLVWTPVGPVPVEDVVRGRMDVLTYDRPWDVRSLPSGRPSEPRSKSVGELHSATPSEWIDNGVQPVWRVSFASGRHIDATHDHRWIVRRRAGNRAPQEAATVALQVGMSVPVPLTAGYGDHLSGRGRSEGYVIGQILGDGCTTGSNIAWCGHDDDALARMRRIVEAAGDRMVVYKTSDSGLQECGITGGAVRALLKQEHVHGLKGLDKALKHLAYPTEFLQGLVEGLIDSDGCVTSSEVTYATVSSTLAGQMQDALLALGVQSRRSVRDNTAGLGQNNLPLHIVSVKDRNSLVRLRERITLSASVLNSSDSKNARLTELAHKVAGQRSRRNSDDDRRGYDQNLAWDRVTRVDYLGERPTYCVTVEPSHTVIWNGIVGLNSIMPMGAFYNATSVLTGTPDTVKGTFYESIQNNKRSSTRRNAKQNHFHHDWRSCAKYNPRYLKFVRKEMLRLREDSDEFQLSYALRWLLERGMFTTSERLEELGDTSMQATVARWYDSPVVLGVDPARKQDSTVVTAVWVDWANPNEFGVYDHRVLDWLEMHGDRWEEQYGRIVDFASNYDVMAIGVDASGVGDVVADRLERLMPRSQIVCLSSNTPDQSARWKHLMEVMNQGLIGWPAGAKVRRKKTYQRFVQQMSDLEKSYQGKYLMAAAPKKADAHDDYCDSLALAVYLTKAVTMPEAEQGSNPFYRR